MDTDFDKYSDVIDSRDVIARIEDLGYMEKEIRWPFTCIDWERVARELQQDYMPVDFDGIDYWIRA